MELIKYIRLMMLARLKKITSTWNGELGSELSNQKPKESIPLWLKY